jgi:hypothetical protein
MDIGELELTNMSPGVPFRALASVTFAKSMICPRSCAIAKIGLKQFNSNPSIHRRTVLLGHVHLAVWTLHIDLNLIAG